MDSLKCFIISFLVCLTVFVLPTNCEETDLEREFRCRETCGFKHKYEMSWKRRMQCAYWRGANKDPEPETECFFHCYGIRIARYQHECFCQYCKLKNDYFPPHKEFCAAPGMNAHIDEGDCDTKFCDPNNMTVSYWGYYCHPAEESHLAEARKDWNLDKAEILSMRKDDQRCKIKCNKNHKSDKEMYHGHHVCAYTEEGHFRPKMNSECYFECRGIKVAKNQNKCTCKYCKMHGYNAAEFCVKPGLNAKIGFNDCEEQVCSSTGQAKHHGRFCDPWDQQQADADESNYGNSV